MLDEFRPLNLSGAARQLGVDPLEVVRLMVACEADLEWLTLSRSDADSLRELSGIEAWWADAGLPDDANPQRAAVLGALGQLLARGVVGDHTTRLDNLWRGLAIDQQVAIEHAVVTLLDEGLLLTAASPNGVQVGITPGSEERIGAIASGAEQHEALVSIWQGD